MNFEYEKDTWHIIKIYIEEQLTNHHINSFENFNILVSRVAFKE